jgi:hypothetical protein
MMPQKKLWGQVKPILGPYAKLNPCSALYFQQLRLAAILSDDFVRIHYTYYTIESVYTFNYFNFATYGVIDS